MMEPRHDMFATPRCASEGVVAGVDIGGTNLRLALADAQGRIVARRRGAMEGSSDARAVTRRIAQWTRELLAEVGLPATALQAMGAGAPGVTDVDRGVVIATSYLLGWRDVPLRDLLQEELGVPAAIDNDVNFAALGECRAGVGTTVDDFVFLAIGTGLGAGMVLNRSLHRGHAWRAGEVGYLLVPGTSNEETAPGAPGALEALVGGEGISEQWRERWAPARTRVRRDAAATEIFDAALTGDALAAEMLHATALVLSYAIYNMALILNCPLFVLGGGVGLHPALIASVREALAARDARVTPRIEPSVLGDDAQLTGAIHAALELAAARR